MKKILFYILPLLAMVGIISSCDDDETKVAHNVTLSISVAYPEGYSEADLNDFSIKVTNAQTSESYTPEKGDNGSYSVVIPTGEYQISASGQLPGYIKALNGLANVSVYDDMSTTLSLSEASFSGLIFKEVYYSMVKTNGKTPYNDQFYELYNNSDQVIYLDNVIFGVLEGTQGVKPSGWVDDNGDLLKICPLGYYVTAFPGSGTDHPLEPGKSVVIATKAMDHKGDPNGAPESPVNLENADWEIYVGDYNQKDVDNPNVPNLDIISQSGSKLVDFMIPYTGNAIVIARLPQGTTPLQYAQDESHLMTNPGSTSTTKYLVIPQEYVLDGIDIVNSNASKRVKRLRSEIDAGTVHNSADYNGKSIRRKVREIKDGRVIYQDTNNSENDFLTDQDPTPGVQPTSAD